MIYWETLSQDFEDLKLEGGTHLQNVYDLLITRILFQQYLTNTIATSNHLVFCDYKVSAQKTQICQQAVRFLGFLLEPGKGTLI